MVACAASGHWDAKPKRNGFLRPPGGWAFGFGNTLCVTLYHWDLPYELHYQGGWLNPQSPDWFAEFTALMTDRRSDRVKYWMTINEPQVFIPAGYVDGMHAPGEKLDSAGVLRIAHIIRSNYLCKPLFWDESLSVLWTRRIAKQVKANTNWTFSIIALLLHSGPGVPQSIHMKAQG